MKEQHIVIMLLIYVIVSQPTFLYGSIWKAMSLGKWSEPVLKNLNKAEEEEVINQISRIIEGYRKEELAQLLFKVHSVFSWVGPCKRNSGQKTSFPAYVVSLPLQKWGEYCILQNLLFADQELEFHGTVNCIKLYVIMPSSFLLISSSVMVMLSIHLQGCISSWYFA